MSDEPRQICPSPDCGMPIYEYAMTAIPEMLDLFCPVCGEHVAHFERDTMEKLAESLEEEK